MLDDFAVHGAVLRRYSRTVDRLTSDQASVPARFRAWLHATGCAVSTVRAYATVAGEFLAFTGTRGGVAGLDAGVVDAFVATLAGDPGQDGGDKLCAIRSFLRFTVGDALAGAAVLEAVPAARPAGGQDPVGAGPGGRDQGPAGDRPRQPVRQTGLRRRSR